MKTCTRCGKTKPLIGFGRDKSTLDKLSPWCKECQSAYMKAYRAAKADKLRQQEKAWRDANAEAVRERERKYKAAHAEEQREYQRKWQADNADHMRQYRKSIVQRIADLGRAWRARNRERDRENARAWWRRNPEKARARRQKWTAANPEKRRAAWHRYQAHKKGNGGSYTAAEWRAMCDWFGNQCLRCGSYDPLTVDHVRPVTKGGSNDISNLQPLCLSCNSSKGDREIDYRDPTQLETFLNSL